MYKHIMVPVDLAHLTTLEKALKTAADLAKHYRCGVTYVGVTGPAPDQVAHNPAEYAEKLETFAKGQSGLHGVTAASKPVVASDPITDLDDKLMRTAEEVGADLVVMATHAPNITDYLWPSNGGKLASHAGMSVFLVRSD